MSYRFMPEGQRADIIRDHATIFATEQHPVRRKLKEREFIDASVDALVSQLRCIGDNTTPEAHMQELREFFAEIGGELGEAPYDGSDAGVAHAWTAEALEFAGVVSETDAGDFDGEDVVIVPSDTFDTVLHGVEDWLRRMAEDLKAQEHTYFREQPATCSCKG